MALDGTSDPTETDPLRSIRVQGVRRHLAVGFFLLAVVALIGFDRPLVAGQGAVPVGGLAVTGQGDPDAADAAPEAVAALPAPSEPITWLLRGQQMRGGTLRVHIDWGKWTDPDHPITGHVVQLSKHGGPWTRTKMRSGTNEGANYRIAFDTTYRFRVRVVDAEGNRSPWAVATRSTRITRVDDRSASVVRTGTWRHRSDATAYRKTLTGSGQAGAGLTLTFTGHGIGIVVPATNHQRNADIYIDGTWATDIRPQAIDPKRPRVLVLQAFFPDGGTHTIEVRVRAGNRPGSRLDAFVVLK